LKDSFTMPFKRTNSIKVSFIMGIYEQLDTWNMSWFSHIKPCKSSWSCRSSRTSPCRESKYTMIQRTQNTAFTGRSDTQAWEGLQIEGGKRAKENCESILTSVTHAAKKAYFNNYKAIIIVRLQTTSLKLLKMG
jgi:hypothetical protein